MKLADCVITVVGRDEMRKAVRELVADGMDTKVYRTKGTNEYRIVGVKT